MKVGDLTLYYMSLICGLSVGRAYNYNIVASKAFYSYIKSNYII
jgi:hypothetical protein